MTKATLVLASEAGTGTDSLLPVLAIFVLAAMALFAAEIFKRWINPIVSLLLTGTLAGSVGPQGFDWLPWIPKVDEFANWGVTVLMFIIGMEFRLDRLAKMWRIVFFGGLTQIVFVGLTVGLVMRLFGFTWGEAILWGILLSMSSTALAAKVLEMRGETETPAGRGSFALLSAQDIAVLPAMLLIPLLVSHETAPDISKTVTVLDLARSVGVLLLLFFGGKLCFNLLIRKSAYTRNRTLMLAILGVICAGSAFVMKLAGLSPALGALVAGLLVSRSEFADGVRASAASFRDFLAPLFFLAIGMLLSISQLREHFWVVLLLVPVTLLVKSSCGALAALLSGYQSRDAVRIGVVTAQIGELSFVLAVDAEHLGLVSPGQHQVFVALAVASMALTPLWVRLGTRLALRLPNRSFPLRLFGSGIETHPEAIAQLSDHVVIAGGGLIGRMCVRQCESQHLLCVVIEANPSNVDRIKQPGSKAEVHFIHGDCRDPEVLQMAGIDRARVVIVAISHEDAMLEALAAARALNHHVPILVKTRLLDSAKRVKDAGATHVVPEDLTAAVETTRVLTEMLARRTGSSNGEASPAK